ncbi:MAG TPA: phytanoyl-CoA dioxygenase family protein, partial [Tepidisphaeraceae bacterium]
PSILAIVRKLIGGEPNLIQDMALLKPPRGREKPWHQDSAYFLFEPAEKVVGAWIALDPALVENGCMHVIPASHLQGPVPHYHDRDCQIADDTVAMERDVCVPLRPGGALFFSSLLHHGTPPNDSPLRRRALQFHYAASDCRKVSAEEKGTIFFDAGGAAACMHGRKISDRK